MGDKSTPRRNTERTDDGVISWAKEILDRIATPPEKRKAKSQNRNQGTQLKPIMKNPEEDD